MKYDLIIAGTGFAGSTIAYQASRAGKRVLMLERRNHIAGNMYEEKDEHGILVQRYGPHSFHTNRKNVYDFLCQVGEWREYILRARVMIDEICTPSPFNFQTIDDFYGQQKAQALKEHLANYYHGEKKVAVVDMLECEDELIRNYAEFLFEKDYRPYTSKQWGIRPEELDISILKRVPVRLDYTDAYFDDTYQFMPQKSFTAIFKEMLNHPNIEVKLQEDINQHITFSDTDATIYYDDEKVTSPIVYTGPLDELFACKYGKLPYRSLHFDYQTYQMDSYQETPGVAYPMAEGFTRITEFKKLTGQVCPGFTTVAVEYPAIYESKEGNEPYYPILTKESAISYEKYCKEAERYPQLYLCGRLAEFKYYNSQIKKRKRLLHMY
jgi:UDP-galactopyranose mutase